MTLTPGKGYLNHRDYTLVVFDLRVPGKMIVRLPRSPGEPIAGEQPAQQQG